MGKKYGNYHLQYPFDDLHVIYMFFTYKFSTFPVMCDFQFIEDSFNDASLFSSFHFLQNVLGILFCVVNRLASAVPNSIIERPANLVEMRLNLFESLSGSPFITLEVVVGHFLLNSASHYVFHENREFGQLYNIATMFFDESIEDVTMGYAIWKSCHSVEVLQANIQVVVFVIIDVFFGEFHLVYSSGFSPHCFADIRQFLCPVPRRILPLDPGRQKGVECSICLDRCLYIVEFLV